MTALLDPIEPHDLGPLTAVPLDVAASQLGLTREGVRTRIRRKQLRATQVRGRVFVYLPSAADPVHADRVDSADPGHADSTAPSAHAENELAQLRLERDHAHAIAALVTAERDRLLTALARAETANAELRVLLLNTQRLLPAPIPAPQDTPTPPETAATRPAVPDVAPSSQRPWWAVWRRG